MKSPFKFLDPYEAKDRATFFGRDTEIQELYKLVTKNRLTFVYGPSGAGKTSLVQCGLANRFGNVDWIPIFIRRGEDINLSLRQELGKLLQLEQPFEGDLPDAINRLFRHYLRPVYLIFDQFEELFILGDHRKEAEQQIFYEQIADLLEEDLPCRILLIMREDYFGHLNEFEKVVPDLYHRKLRVEPMSRENLHSVIVGSCVANQIGFEYPQRGPEKILDNMFAGKSSIHMPYVQVYLHMLFQQAVAAQGAKEDLQFSDQVIDAVGPITDVLGQFLQEQEIQIRNSLEKQHADLPENLIRQVLDIFVTKEGTKSSVPYFIDPNGQIQLKGSKVQRLSKLEAAHISDTLNELERTRIIRRLDERFELAHDSLAKLIDEQRTAEQRQLIEVSQRIETGYQEYIDSDGKYFFTAGQLARIEPFKDKLALLPAWSAFLENSVAEAKRLEQLEVEQARQKLRRQRIFSGAIGIVAIIAIAVGVLAWRNATMAEQAKQTATISALAAKAWEIYRDDHTLAMRIAQAAVDLDSTNSGAQQTLSSILGISTTTFYKSVFSGHDFEVTALDFSPDNQLVASGSYDYSIRVWRSHNGEEVFRLLKEDGGHTQSVTSVRFSPDGKSIYSAGKDGRIVCVSSTGELIYNTQTHRAQILDMDLSPDGTFLATAAGDSTAAIWDTKAKERLRLRGHQAAVLSIDISEDGQRILTGSADGTARLWNLQGQLLRTFPFPGKQLNAVQFSPSSEQIFVGLDDHTAHLLSIEGRPLITLGGHQANISKVRFTQDGQYLLTASYDNTARLWSLAGEELLNLIGHSERLSALAVSSDGEWIATGAYDFTAKVWNIPLNLNNRGARHTEPVSRIITDREGQVLFSASNDHLAKQWDLKGRWINDFAGHTNWVNGITISPDNEKVLTASSDGTIKIWDRDGRIMNTLDSLQASFGSIAISPNGQFFAAGGNDEIWLWNAKAELSKKWQADETDVRAIDFSPDNRLIVSGGASGKAKIWTIAGELVDSIDLQDASVPMHWVSFSPDGERIYTVGRYTAIKVWDLQGKLLDNIYGHLADIYHLTWHPKGKLFATSSWDKSARIWTKEGELLQTLIHPDGVYAATFVAKGEQIATACRDKIIRIWDVASGKLLRTIGDQIDPSILSDEDRLARLADIPFNPDHYKLTPEVLIQIFRFNPTVLTGFGHRYLTLAETVDQIDYEKALQDLDVAELFFQEAKKVSTEDQYVYFDSLIAKTYLSKANHYIVHRKPALYLKAARKGLEVYEDPLLWVFATIGEAMTSPSSSIMAQALEMSRDSTTSCASCEELGYPNVGEAMQYEPAWYRDKYGINTPGLRQLIQVLENGDL